MPIFDKKVTLSKSHLLKVPYSMHRKTSKIARLLETIEDSPFEEKSIESTIELLKKRVQAIRNEDLNN
jgi:hypothetical protein